MENTFSQDSFNFNKSWQDNLIPDCQSQTSDFMQKNSQNEEVESQASLQEDQGIDKSTVQSQHEAQNEKSRIEKDDEGIVNHLFDDVIQSIRTHLSKNSASRHHSMENAQNDWYGIIDFEKPELGSDNLEMNKLKGKAQDLLFGLGLSSNNINRSTIMSKKEEPKQMGQENKKEESNEEEKVREEETTVINQNYIWREYQITRILGQGAHGVVLEVKNERGKVKAIKLYTKKIEHVFSNEVSVLSMLTEIDQERKLSDIIYWNNLNGIIIDAGVGTLRDFKKFLRTEKIKLNEMQLLVLSTKLLQNYLIINHLGFCHRDIKPENIILRPNDLSVQLIDFSLATCLEPGENISGVVGTLGYIAPHIWNNKGDFTQKDLIYGDLFSLGVTILELAAPNFFPRQENGKKAIKEVLQSLSNKKKLKKFLQSLLFLSDYKGSKEPSCFHLLKSPFNSEEFGLHKYYEKFMKFLRNRSPKEDKKLEITPEMTIQLPDLSRNLKSQSQSDLFVNYLPDSFAGIEDPEFLKSMNIKEKNQVLICYENIAKNYLKKGDIKKFEECLERVIEELSQDQNIICSPLLYSTLGIYFAEFKQQTDDSIKMFSKGLEEAKDPKHKLILLNNYGIILTQLENSEEKYNKAFQDAYKIFQEEIVKTRLTCYFIDSWLSMETSAISPKQEWIQIEEHRSAELICSIEVIVARMKDVYGESRLFYITFYNYCFVSALFFRYLNSSQGGERMERINRKLAQYFNYWNDYSPRMFGRLEILCRLMHLVDICLNEPETERSELLKIDQEAKFLKEKKDLIYSLFGNEYRRLCDFNKLFLEMKDTSIFFVMIGCTFLSIKSLVELQEKKRLLLDRVSIILESSDSIEFECQDVETLNEIFSDPEHTKRLIIPTHLVECFINYRFQVSRADSRKNNKYSWSLSHLNLEVFSFCFPEALNICPKWRNNLKSVGSLCLALSRCQIYDSFLPTFFANLILSKLSLYFMFSTPLQDDNLEYVAKAIGSLKNLKELKLFISKSFMTDKGLKLIEGALKELRELEILEIYLCHCPNITERALISLASTTNESSQLKKVIFDIRACGKITTYWNKDLTELKKGKFIFHVAFVSYELESYRNMRPCESNFRDLYSDLRENMACCQAFYSPDED